MITEPDTSWQAEFGIGAGRSAAFFASKDDLDSRDPLASHSHVVRRAFDFLNLNGVLNDGSSPLVYFKVVRSIRPADLVELHRRFWNHGEAPILAVISPSEVQIYSGLARPREKAGSGGQSSGLVTTIHRASAALREFLPAVESGEFFREHPRSFQLTERVDHALLNNLSATRQKLASISGKHTSVDVLDAFLCRLVFTCYLFDREVIGEEYLNNLGFSSASHLRDILGLKRRSEAKAALYRLFRKLAIDFNGDLFSDDLAAEGALVSAAHIAVVDAFFRGTDVTSGLQAFWPYDFGAIPIETISAIYERFLKATDKKTGAVYTPRFLAELVLDVGLAERKSLLGLRCLDPACGSGIFLVGLFNRMAEEWKRAHPAARNERRATELVELLRSSIFGIDSNPTACRIAAFSLYLAYLDQLSPRDIQKLQATGRVLPRLVAGFNQGDAVPRQGGIWCGDFFEENGGNPSDIDLVIGNPPWGSTARTGTLAAEWLRRHDCAVPDRQIAAAFMWKAATHLAPNGRVCLVLPHGILFNHSTSAVSFQKLFIQKYALDRVLNLTDYQSFLFNEARHPALIVSYRGQTPGRDHNTAYWVPKTNWKMLRAEIITISEQDRSNLSLECILEDLDNEDAPQIWKRMSWATPRDRRLLDRLSELPRLRDRVRRAWHQADEKPWLIAEGFQPLGPNDDRAKADVLNLPSNLFIKASSRHLRLFLLEGDCIRRSSTRVTVRARSNKRVEVFDAPHVLVAKGFGSIAFADFAVSFQHALRGIRGPTSDRNLLIFLAAYMRSSLAQYYQFHTSSNWGVSRQEVHVDELLRLPFPLPDTLDNPERGTAIIEEVAHIVQSAARDAERSFLERDVIVDRAQSLIDPLIYEYFDVIPSEQILVEDTVSVSVASFRPGTGRQPVPAIEPSTPDARQRYTDRLCNTLNGWARGGRSLVTGSDAVSEKMGLGLVTLEKTSVAHQETLQNGGDGLLPALDRLRDVAAVRTNTFELARGIKVFDGSRLYLVKPLDLRYWSETAALNDADEIAGSILMHHAEHIA
jgi:hypothetical protein